MATESTAIVNLLDLVKSKPMPLDAGDDALFGGRARFDPMAMPVAAQPVMLPQPFVRQPAPALDHLKTHRVTRVAQSPAAKKFALPVGLFIVVMVLLSVYLAKGDKKTTAPKATIVHAPAPTVQMPVVQPPAPTPQPVVAAAPVVTPIESKEPTVTPIEAPVAEVESTVPTVPAVAETTDEPAAEPTVPVADAKPAKAAKAAKSRRHHHAAARPIKREKRVATAEAPEAAPAAAPAKTEKLGGKGALALSSSPAREVWIDGRNTKQMTPQRLTLVPGTHNITLVDKKSHGAKTFQVEIEANKTLKIAKTY